MKGKLLYSDIWPLLVEEGNKTIEARFIEEIKKSDQLEIAVGFASCDSLLELDKLITQQNVKNVCLILGMYFENGFPEKLLRLALEINAKWQKAGMGEIRLSYPFKYHGKLYCFLRGQKTYSAIIGSPNLSFLTTEEPIRFKWQQQQYEIALSINDSEILEEIKNHIDSLKSENVSKNIAFLVEKQSLDDMKIEEEVVSRRVFKIKKNIFKK